MTKSAYCKLIDEVCALCAMGNPEPYYDAAELHVGGIRFVLQHGGTANDDCLFISCSYGTPPLALLPLITVRLLEANLKLFAPGGMRFGIEPERHEVFLAGSVRIAGLDAPALIALLQRYAEQAWDWRDHYFLLPPPEQREPDPMVVLSTDEAGEPS